MDPDPDFHHRRVPSLVILCQRAAVAHVDAICSLGDDLTYTLVKPILERCSIEQLLRLEQSSPHLQPDTAEIWKDLCFRKYILAAEERFSPSDDPQEPDSWKSRYFLLETAEAKRMDEAASKLRSKRIDADERKKEKEVKYIDRLPVAKRARTESGWNHAPPKTLFQKAKINASRRQQAFITRVLPPASTSKNYRVLPPNPSATLPSTSSSATSSRVTVNTTIHRRSSASSSSISSCSTLTHKGPSVSSSVSSTSASSNSVLPRHRDKPPMPPPPSLAANPKNSSPRKPPAGSPPTNLAIPSTPEAPPLRPIVKSPGPLKKDPMACLFVPKRPPKIQLRPQRPV